MNQKVQSVLDRFLDVESEIMSIHKSAGNLINIGGITYDEKSNLKLLRTTCISMLKAMNSVL